MVQNSDGGRAEVLLKKPIKLIKCECGDTFLWFKAPLPDQTKKSRVYLEL